MLRKLGRSSATHHWWFIGAWLVVLAAVWAIAIGLGAKPNNSFDLPGSQSQDALDLLEKDFPSAAGTSATIVYYSKDGITTDTDVSSAVGDSIDAVSKLTDVSSVTSPLTTSELVSSDGDTALAGVSYSKAISELSDNGAANFSALERAIEPYQSDSLEIQLGGSLPGAQQVLPETSIIVVGLIAALIVLLIALGTWWSFAWPVVGGLAGVGLGVGLVHILESFVDVPTISDTAAVMVGLGVGID